MALGPLDVGGPAGVIFDGVDAEADDFAVAPGELSFKAGHAAELGGADRREVFGVGEEDAPGVAKPLVETDGTAGGHGLKVGSQIIDTQCHK